VAPIRFFIESYGWVPGIFYIHKEGVIDMDNDQIIELLSLIKESNVSIIKALYSIDNKIANLLEKADQVIDKIDDIRNVVTP
jgi:hypothetical protein